MDFDNVLSMASQNQGLSSLPKRYSLKPGPPKKDPRVKGVNSAAVQAYLKKQEIEQKKKDLQQKKQKEVLLAKRVELKSDRKARAMASRTKDNFHGYNGVPVVDKPKKRHSKSEEHSGNEDACYDEDNYEFEGTDSESEPEPPAVVRPQERSNGSIKLSNTQKKPSMPPRPAPPPRAAPPPRPAPPPRAAPPPRPAPPPRAAPPPMNFADLLKLAQKKQYEPVDLKPTKKTEERLRTAEEIKELELERKARNQDKWKDVKPDKNSGHKNGKSSTNSHKKNMADREGISHRTSEKSSSGLGKTPKPHTHIERQHSSAKLSHGSKPSSSSSGALSSKAAMKGTSASVKQTGPRPQSVEKPTISDLKSKKGYPGQPQGKIISSGNRADAASNSSRPSGHGQGIKDSGHTRPSQGITNKKGPPQKLVKGDVLRSGGNPPPRPVSNGPMRSAPAGSSKQAGPPQQPRPGSSVQGRPVPGGAKPAINGQGRPSRPSNTMGAGPGRPACTVVSETISSKNFTHKQGMAPAPQGLRTIIGPTGHRIIARPPEGPSLPAITSNYKRKYEDEEEYDSEMEDFIDDEGEGQDEISKHIREIFGYDRSRYKDESDYALKFMESSWKEQQKEEARSLRLGIKEDEDDMRMEEEEMKRKQEMKAKRTKT